MNKLIFCLVALVLATPAMAQVRSPIYQDRNGSYQGAAGIVCIAPDATACPTGTTADPVHVSGTSGSTAQEVQGNVAAGAADGTTKPVKAGGVYNSGPPTLANAQRGDLQLGTRGGLHIQLMRPDSASPLAVVTSLSQMSSGITALVTASPAFGFNGTSWDPLPGDTNGLVTQPYAKAGSRWTYAPAAGGIVNSTTAVTVATAGGASIRNYVTGVQCDSDALGAATEVAIRDGAGGTVLWRGGIAMAGWLNGRDIVFMVPLKGTANTLVEIVTLTASITGGVRCNLQGFTGA